MVGFRDEEIFTSHELYSYKVKETPRWVEASPDATIESGHVNVYSWRRKIDG